MFNYSAQHSSGANLNPGLSGFLGILAKCMSQLPKLGHRLGRGKKLVNISEGYQVVTSAITPPPKKEKQDTWQVL